MLKSIKARTEILMKSLGSDEDKEESEKETGVKTSELEQ